MRLFRRYLAGRMRKTIHLLCVWLLEEPQQHEMLGLSVQDNKNQQSDTEGDQM